MAEEEQALPRGPSGRTALQVAEEAVRAAGGLVMTRFRGAADAPPQVAFKGPDNLVTDVDRAAEEAAMTVLDREFPEYGMLAEESGRRAGRGDHTWVLDPLDGTRNFVNGVPFFAVSLALTRGDELLLGLTYDPARDELFHAVLGGGSHLNGRRTRVASPDAPEHPILGFDVGPMDERTAWLLEMLRGLWPDMQALRISGSAALGYAYLAAGRLHLYAHHQLAPWDVAAGLLLVREAGGVATDFQGGMAEMGHKAVVAASRAVHEHFMGATRGTPGRSVS